MSAMKGLLSWRHVIQTESSSTWPSGHCVWGHRTGRPTCFYVAPGHRSGSIPVHPLHLRLHLQPLNLPPPEPLWWLCDPQRHHWQSWWGVQRADAELDGLVSAEPRSCWYTSGGNNMLHLLWWASRVWALRGCPPTSTWIYIWTIHWTGPIIGTLCIGRLRADSS